MFIFTHFNFIYLPIFILIVYESKKELIVIIINSYESVIIINFNRTLINFF